MYKKVSIFSLLIMVAVAFSASMPVLASTDVSAGNVIKGKGNPTLYYLGDDGKRYVFPNSNTYFSWFDNFENVQEVDLSKLYNYELGGNVTYKPGAILVKIQTDPKVYAVDATGKLRWVKTENIAKKLYGNNWNKLVDDVPDSFFTNYQVGEPIETENEFVPAEEEAQAPTVSHVKGFKPLMKVRAKSICQGLEGSLGKLQNRYERWGLDITSEADEILEKCYAIKPNLINQLTDKKVNVCHEAKTLSIGAPAVKAHLNHGDKIGKCEGDTTDTTDTTAPSISNIVVTPTATSTIVAWDTNENSTGKIYYSTAPISSATEIIERSDSNSATTHSINLIDLILSTEYHYYIKAEDASGNIATSAEAVFTTLGE